MSALQIVAIGLGVFLFMWLVIVALAMMVMGKQSAERADAMEAAARAQDVLDQSKEGDHG